MSSAERPKAGRPHLRRDNQKWVFDWVIKETGKVLHFQSDEKRFLHGGLMRCYNKVRETVGPSRSDSLLGPSTQGISR